ncbi:MAG: MFS transporter [Spirochaetota bacterium]
MSTVDVLEPSLSKKVKIGYGIGDFGANLLFQSVALYLLFYFTDVMMIDAAVAGSLFLVAKLWDAVSDPLMGNLSDRTRTRYGAKRVYLLIGAIPLGISFFLLFYGPQLDGLAKNAYALAVFVCFCTCYTIVNVPYGSLTAAMSKNSQERAEISGYRMGFALLGTLVAAGITKPLVAAAVTPSGGFRTVGLVFGFAAALFTLVTFFSTSEKVSPDCSAESTLKTDLNCILKNKPFLVLTLATLFQYIALGIIASMVNYYFKYALPMEDFIPIAFLSLFATAIAAMPFWVWLSARGGKRLVFNLGMIILAISLLLLFFVTEPCRLHIIPILMFGGLGLSTIYLSPWSMVPDTVEYAEWKLGNRREGTLYGVFYFAQKLAIALSGFICGRGLALTGYIPNQVQTFAAERGIRTLMVFIPVIIITFGIIAIHFYTIDADFHQQMNREIEGVHIDE